MTLSESTDKFVKDYEGKTIGYPGNNYLGECLSLVKQFIKEHYHINPPPSGCNGARCYWSKFPDPLGTILKKVPNTPDLIPKKGWIAVWDGSVGGGFGHIDIVAIENSTQNYFGGFDANWGGRQAHLVTHNYNNVEGFLAPLNEEDDMNKLLEYLGMPNEDEAIVKLTEHLGVKDSKCNWGSEGDDGGYLGSCREKTEILEHDIVVLNDRLEDCENKPIEPPIESEGEWRANGKTVTTEKDGVLTTINYEIK